ncbi:MAG: 2-amino-4-hydroxy-6-hydroxymethyldihydropteridine diphosphokinase [Sphingopyxis sp.]
MNLPPISADQLYAIALGSNRCHGLHGRPAAIIDAAITALGQADIAIIATAPTHSSSPIGPSKRRFANSVIVIQTPMSPPILLGQLKQIERQFGRRGARRWGQRVLDLDIILWSGRLWQTPELMIPHPHWRSRPFVLGPLNAIAPHWRDPVSGLRVRHIAVRQNRPNPVKHR